MALRNIVEQGDPVLMKMCRPVKDFNRRLHILLDDMRETLDNVGGAGLAAPQVGVLRRVCLVMDADTMDDEIKTYYELVNPEIIAQDGEQTGLEGCLSVPGKWGIVTRPEYVKVRAQDRNGEWREYEGTGLTARGFCHEIEHLNGHLYTELIDRFLTDEEVEEYQRQQEEEEERKKAEKNAKEA